MRGEHNTLPSPSRAYQALLLTMTMLTCPHLAVSLHPHAPPCPLHRSCRCRCAPHDCTHHIAIPLAAARTVSPSPSRLHVSCRRPPHGCTCRVAMPIAAAHTCRCAPCAGKPPACTFSYFLFLLTSSFMVQSPRSRPRHHTQHKDGNTHTVQ
jgi:hypothetical protein